MVYSVLFSALALGLPFGLAVFPVHAFRCASCHHSRAGMAVRLGSGSEWLRVGGLGLALRAFVICGMALPLVVLCSPHPMSPYLACRYWCHVKAAHQAGKAGTAADEVAPYSLTSALSDSACTVVSRPCRRRRHAVRAAMDCCTSPQLACSGLLHCTPATCWLPPNFRIAISLAVICNPPAWPFAGQGRRACGGCTAACAARAARRRGDAACWGCWRGSWQCCWGVRCR